MSKKILHEIFDIDAEDVTEVEEEVTDIVPVEENQQLVVGGAAPPPEEDAEDIKLQADFTEAVNNIKDAIEVAKDAVEKVAAIASDTEDDKDFNALNNLLKTIVDASEKTVGMYTKKMEYKERKRKILAPPGGYTEAGPRFNIEKAVFTGTLDQLHTAIGEQEKGGE